MDTCVICNIAYDPCVDEEGNLLIDYETHICRKCLKRIENGEIKVEDYDLYAIKESNKKEETKKMGIGVGIIVLNANNETLLLLRNEDQILADSDMRLEGTYTLPSGKVKFGETFEEAGKRKLKEETGLDVNTEDLKVISLSSDINEYAHYATIGLIANNYSGNFKLKESKEFTNYGWYKLDNLPNNLCLPSKAIINNYLNKKIYSINL